MSHSCPTNKSAFSVISAIAFFFIPICNHDHTGTCWLLFKVVSLGFGSKESNSFLSKHSERPLVFASYRCVSIQNCGTRKRWHPPPYPFLTTVPCSSYCRVVCVQLIFTHCLLSPLGICGEPTASCFIIVNYAWCGEGVCVCVFAFVFLCWFSVLTFLLESGGLQQSFL